MKTVKRMRAFLLFFEKNGNRMRRITEVMVRGRWGAQSWNIPYSKSPKEIGTLS
jgi:hypothetical protein